MAGYINNKQEGIQMQSYTVPVKLFQRSSDYWAEIDAFAKRVRPAYANTFVKLWNVFFRPLERAANYFQRRNTESFVAEFEAAYERAKKNDQ